ncbi:MAG: hypothetical protein P4L41_07745 [Flavipsychrobacter sp.]|nr:hypothetical protein [Flavipsychrobacter sp.]
MPSPITTLQSEPLDKDDIELLQTIVDTRRPRLLKAYAVLILIAAISAFRGLKRMPRGHTNQDKYYEYNIGSYHISPMAMLLFGEFFLESIVITSGIIIYLKTIHSFVKDIRAGVKEMVPYEILQKEYFEVNGKYYFKIDNPDHMHHEVDADTFNSYSEGDTVYLYRTVYAQFFFDASGSYTIL